jgi:cephalosporin-C deacetylase-like acetyl esterase
MASITTREAAVRRQAEVRAKVLKLIGGLPERTPLNAKVLGTTQLDGFRIEKVLFESQPGFFVTALLYVPDGASEKRAAVVMAPGHGPAGKASETSFAVAFARNGFVVLSYDPIGQGERLQYPDPEDPAKSLASRPTGEHGEAGLQPVLIGDAAARYWAWDGIRAVDYLAQRPEVNASRIGAFGCSGGGTITALTAALDQRIAATAVACYNTSFDTLLPSIGPQDAEQSTPGFIAAGLDFPDWIELVAPRPYAAVATYSDMFPFAGARVTVAEARRFYALFDPSVTGGSPGVSDGKEAAIPTGPALNTDTANKVPLSASLQFITGPGGHGALSPILGDILAFFVRNLQPEKDVASIKLPAANAGSLPKLPQAALQVTPTGQVRSSYPASETVSSLNRKRAQQLLSAKHPALHDAALKRAVRQAIGATAQPGSAHFDRAALQAVSGEIKLNTPAGTPLRGHIAVPTSTGKHPAVLMLVPDDIEGTGEIAKKNHERFEQLAAQGNVVLAITPRPSYPGTDDMKSPMLGPFYLLSLRAELVGKTILGLRVDDAITAMDYLAQRTDVDGSQITAEGSGHMGTVLIHAALLDTRMAHATARDVLVSYRSLVEAPMPVGAPEDIVPGVLRRYDLPEVRSALGKRLTVEGLLNGDADLSADSTPLSILNAH